MLTTAFAGGEAGAWYVESVDPVTGPSLPIVPRLAVYEDAAGAGTRECAQRHGQPLSQFIDELHRALATDR
ncbi:MAG: hypothetical protein M3P93_09910 [Actinomycetota bacterium]|nr:hypothetical protein [Actinomycetota bacterium]